MSLGTGLVYLFSALVYAAAVTMILLGTARLFGARWNVGRVALVLSILFVVFLAIHPFPDPAGLDCTKGGKALQFAPFSFFDRVRHLTGVGASAAIWIQDKIVMATVMNLVLFALVGAALVAETRKLGHAILFAILLSGGIELAQLTGLFGIYPCRYRTVDIDDLIMNITGIVIGYMLVRGIFGQKRLRL